MKILWLVTARSGSKSIPDKNIKLLDGKPLLTYPIKAALSTMNLAMGDVWLSTDSHEYARIGSEAGAKVPFLRPEALASDKASSVDVVIHAMEYALSINRKFDYIGLLEPTSPFLTGKHLSEALYLLEKDHSSSLVAVREHRPNTIFVQDFSQTLTNIYDNLSKLKELGRQNFKVQITPSGGLYVSRWDEFLKNQSFYNPDTLAYLVSDLHGLEIDEPIDWEWAEFVIKRGLIDLSENDANRK